MRIQRIVQGILNSYIFANGRLIKIGWFNNLGLVIAISLFLLAVVVLFFLYYFSGRRVFGGTIKMGNGAKKPRDE